MHRDMVLYSAISLIVSFAFFFCFIYILSSDLSEISFRTAVSPLKYYPIYTSTVDVDTHFKVGLGVVHPRCPDVGIFIRYEDNNVYITILWGLPVMMMGLAIMYSI